MGVKGYWVLWVPFEGALETLHGASSMVSCRSGGSEARWEAFLGSTGTFGFRV